jgi:hypothetical protein
MQRGYVKVWRKIEDSGLIQLPNTLALFMHILLNATHKDRKVGTPNGVILLKRGQYISGRIELGAKLKQTEQQIRTSLKRLVDLEILTIEATNRFSVYTIENYSKYQDSDDVVNQQDNHQTTNNQPTDNQQTTTKQELNNLNIKEKTLSPRALLEAESIPANLINDWLKIRNKKRQPLTETALLATKREAEKARMSLQDVIQKCCEKSWAGFEASYLEDKKAKPPNGKPMKGLGVISDEQFNDWLEGDANAGHGQKAILGNG